jgi:hypothetical protein
MYVCMFVCVYVCDPTFDPKREQSDALDHSLMNKHMLSLLHSVIVHA